MKAYIVGKGESLNYLNESYFEDGDIYCINESVLKVESLKLNNKIYSMQKDGDSPKYLNNCPINNCNECPANMVYPIKATLMLHEHESKYCLKGYENRIIFDNEKNGLNKFDHSAMSCVRYLKLNGYNEIILLCFDSVTSNKSKSIMNKNIGEIERSDYLIAKTHLLNELIGVNHKFIEPTL
jgi:hypothetical protein